MTRDERIQAAVAEYVREHGEGTPTPDGVAAMLDAALADLGGLDGLDGLNRALDLARNEWGDPHDTPAVVVEGLTAAARYWQKVAEAGT